MTDDHDQPTPAEADQVERVGDAIYELVSKRASSMGLLDVAVEVDGWFVDGELLFSEGPDMGFSLDAGAGHCRYCELLGADGERWLEHVLEDLPGINVADDAGLDEQALAVLRGLLDARRPLLTPGA